MIYITGDCHGDYRRFNSQIFPEGKEMTKEDYVIICGDFGFWDDSAEGKYWRKWLDEKPFTTLWVDGNHENYDLLKTIPVEEWHGGKVQFIEPSVIHLMRGQVFDVDSAKIFSFGGARSHDIQGGVLEPDAPDFRQQKKKLDAGNLCYRINHVSWWEEEMPCQSEFDEGLKNLVIAGFDVDYIVSHCCATSTQAILSGGLYEPDSLTDYLENVKNRTKFTKWFFGHYHLDRNVSDKEIALYEQMIRIW